MKAKMTILPVLAFSLAITLSFASVMNTTNDPIRIIKMDDGYICPIEINCTANMQFPCTVQLVDELGDPIPQQRFEVWEYNKTTREFDIAVHSVNPLPYYLSIFDLICYSFNE